MLQDIYCSCASGSWLQLCIRIFTTVALQDLHYCGASGSPLQLCFRIFIAAVLQDYDYSCVSGSLLQLCIRSLTRVVFRILTTVVLQDLHSSPTTSPTPNSHLKSEVGSWTGVELTFRPWTVALPPGIRSWKLNCSWAHFKILDCSPTPPGPYAFSNCPI